MKPSMVFPAPIPPLSALAVFAKAEHSAITAEARAIGLVK
jgi:hypothetical protein